MGTNFLMQGSRRTFRRNGIWFRRRFLPHQSVPRLLMLMWSVFFSLVGGYYILDRLHVFASAPLPPSHLVSVNDDHMATIKWNPSPDSDTVGYKVSWSESGGLHKVAFTSYPDIQIQPLEDGKTYAVSVQSVNKQGELSTVVGPVIAQSDSSYVKSISQQMNGMFDDFNDNAYNGLPNPLHWYTTLNNASSLSMAFVSGIQQHLEMLVQNNLSEGNGERASVTMRSLKPFDFTNRTGAVAFDFDWGQNPLITNTGEGRYQWALTISPTLADDINYDSLFNNSQAIYPLEAFQIYMQDDTISFRKIANGVVVGQWNSVYSHTHPFRDINVLKHSLLKLNRNSAQLYVDGVQVLTASDIDLGFSKGWIYNQQMAVNLPKGHVPFALAHVDNIGFDAPNSSAPEIHTYTAGGYGESDRKNLDFFNNSATYTIQIPDITTGEQAERLFVDANIQNDITPKVTVNGVTVSWPEIPQLNDHGNYDARVLSLPVGTLHQGTNIVVISVDSKDQFTLSMQNVHAEIEFAQGTLVSYTPYTVPFSGDTIEAKIPPIAPIPLFGKTSIKDGDIISGTVSIGVLADATYSLLSTGEVNPLTQVEIDVDGVPQTISTLLGPTVKSSQTLQLDTTKIPNGQHTITLTAYGSERGIDGKIVSLNSFYPLLQNNPLDNQQLLRRIVVVNNGTKQPTNAPTISLLPTITPTPIITATPTVSSNTSSEGATFGNATIGAVLDVDEANHISGSRFVTGEKSGNISQIHVFIGKSDTAPNNLYQVAIYTDNQGKPGKLLATSPTETIVPTAWNVVPLTATLVPNTAYWLMYNTNASSPDKNNMTYETTAQNYGISIPQIFGSWPQTISSYSSGNWQFSLYSTYGQ